MAALISYAQHDPKNMPAFKASGETAHREPVDDTVSQAKVRGFFIGMALNAKTSNA